MLKKSYLIAVFLFCFVFAHSQGRNAQGGNVTVFSDRDAFYLYVNGVQYNNRPSKQVRIEQMKDHIYDFQVEFVGGRQYSLSKKGVSILSEEGEYLDLTYLANHTRSNRIHSLTLYALFPADNNLPDPRSGQVFVYGRPKKIVDSELEPGYENENYYGDEMTTSEFNNFLKTIGQGGFDNDKLKIASMSTSQVAFSLNQIKDVLKKFSWDESKLAFAKMAYANCLEKRNYVMLTDELSFGDSKSKLLDFIKNQPIDNDYLERMDEAELNRLIKMMNQGGFDEDKLKILATVSDKVSFPVVSIKRILRELN